MRVTESAVRSIRDAFRVEPRRVQLCDLTVDPFHTQFIYSIPSNDS